MRAYKINYNHGGEQIVVAGNFGDAEKSIRDFWGADSIDYIIHKIEEINSFNEVIISKH